MKKTVLMILLPIVVIAVFGSVFYVLQEQEARNHEAMLEYLYGPKDSATLPIRYQFQPLHNHTSILTESLSQNRTELWDHRLNEMTVIWSSNRYTTGENIRYRIDNRTWHYYTIPQPIYYMGNIQAGWFINIG